MGGMMRGTRTAEVIKELGQRGLADIRVAATGTISSVDPKKMVAKVKLGIEGIETGWLPIGTILAGNGYGIVCIPEDHTEVTVIFDNGDLNTGKIVLCNWNDTDTPPAGLNPGEVYLLSKAGAFIKMDKASKMTISGGKEGTITVDGTTGQIVATAGDKGVVTIDGTNGITINGPVTITGGDVNISGGNVNLTSGGKAVARQGDTVSVDTTTGQGTITSGSSSVFA